MKLGIEASNNSLKSLPDTNDNAVIRNGTSFATANVTDKLSFEDFNLRVGISMPKTGCTPSSWLSLLTTTVSPVIGPLGAPFEAHPVENAGAAILMQG